MGAFAFVASIINWMHSNNNKNKIKKKEKQKLEKQRFSCYTRNWMWNKQAGLSVEIL